MRAIGSPFRRVGIAFRSEAGPVATEYGLLLMFIAIVVAATAYGLSVSGLFGRGGDAFP